jgi:hypothetical protein
LLPAHHALTPNGFLNTLRLVYERISLVALDKPGAMSISGMELMQMQSITT